MRGRVVGCLDAILRGVGQVMLQGNALAGLIFLIGVFNNSRLLGIAVIVGTTTSTATAWLLSVDREQVRDGLFGFNGALVAIALMYFLEPEPLAWGYVVVGCALSTILMAALVTIFDGIGLPTLTAPFVLATWAFVLATARFGRLESTDQLPTAGLPASASVEGAVSSSTVLEGVLNGVAQVFFQSSAVTGAIFVVALLVSSRLAALLAVLGSLTGLLVAWTLGAAEPAIRSGAFGFNSVLTAIALGSVFLVLDRTSTAYILLAVVVTAVTFPALSAALEPIGMPAMTMPFVLVVWLFLLARPAFPQLRTR